VISSSIGLWFVFVSFLVLPRSEVGVNEELCEEDKVRAVHGEGDFGRALRDPTHLSALIEKVGVVSNEAAKDHLNDLRGGDYHRNVLRHPDPQSTEEVVGVHHGVDNVVHADVPSSWSDALCECMPRKQQYSDVMVPVEEDEVLLPQDNEDSVSQLRDFGQGEQPGPQARDTVLNVGRGAD